MKTVQQLFQEHLFPHLHDQDMLVVPLPHALHGPEPSGLLHFRVSWNVIGRELRKREIEKAVKEKKKRFLSILLPTNKPQLTLAKLKEIKQFWWEALPSVQRSICISKIAWWYCHRAYLTDMWSTSWETLGWMKHKLESRFPGEISITSDKQMTPSLWQKVKN